MRTIRLIGYRRVSTDEQAARGSSLQLQLEKIESYCRAKREPDKEWLLVDVETDDGYSGKTLERPGIQRALARLEAGEANALIIPYLDRLTRSIRDLNDLLDRYFKEGKGYELVSVSDSLDTTSAGGRLVINVLMSVAQWQREYIVERTTEVIRGKKARGERTGQIPYGKQLDLAGPRNEDGNPIQLIDHPMEQSILRLIDSWRAQDWTLREIAAELNRRNVPTRRNRGPWYPSAIAAIILRRRKQDHGVDRPEADPQSPAA